MNKNKIKVLIPDGESGPSLQVVRCLGLTSKYKVFVLSSYRNALTGKSKYCEQFFVTEDDSFSQKRLDQVIEIIKTNGINIVLPTFLPGFEFCLRYKDILESYTKLPLITKKETYLKAAYKDTLSKLCEMHAIRVPKSINLCNANLKENIKAFQFPVLLKPSDKYSGSGIQVFNNQNSLYEYIKSQAWGEIDSGYIIQEYLEMETIGVNVICQSGKIRTFTMQRGLLAPPKKFSFSETIQFFEEQEIFDFVQSIMEKFEWEGVTNIDILFDFKTREIYLLEINPRFWGTTLCGAERAGINFPDLLIQISLNPTFDNFPKDFKKIKYSKLNSSIVKKLLRGNSPVKLSETGINFLVSDPLPTLLSQLI